MTVYTLYNMTEISTPLVSGPNPEKTGICGKPRSGVELRVVDENDCEVPAGGVGELIVRADAPWALNSGYNQNPEATVKAWRNGWFHTGDAFRCDEDGWYYFVDRMRDTIRRRGENISSFEVENAVLEFPGVVECAAVGIRTPLGDDEVMAAVIVGDADAFDPAALVAFLETRIATFMVPRYVEAMDDFPRNATTGRVRKHELRARGVTTTTWDRLADT